MRLSEYAACDATELARLVARGEVTPAELRYLAADGVRRLNPGLNAVIELFEDRVTDGDPETSADGPLAGVPFFLKDIGAADAGRLSEMGSRMLAGYRADHSSFLTRRFKQAGLTNLGRTTTPEAGFAGTTESVACGRTANPWDPARSPGGSSGGAAAMVAAGVVPLAHGSDGAGSIRIPASLCGLVGLKPTRGRVSCGPDFDELQFGCACEFVLTRTVRDAAVVLDAVAVAEPGDPFVLARPAGAGGLLRVVVSTTNWATGAPVSETLAAAARTVAADLEAMGHAVTEVERPFDPTTAYAANRLAFNSTLLLLEPFGAMLGRSVGPDMLEPVVLDAARKMAAMSARDFFLESLGFNVARREIGAFFQGCDVLVTPTLAVEHVDFGTLDPSAFDTVDAFREASERTLFTFTSPFNVGGQPAISLPLGSTAEGTPVGVQLVTGFGREDLLLTLAAALERRRPWIDRIPPVHVSRL